MYCDRRHLDSPKLEFYRALTDERLTTIDESQELNSSQRAYFLECLEKDQRRLYAYIYAFLSDPHACDDVFQETCVTLWSDFSKFTPGTNFSKWANGIAFNRIRNYRRKHKHTVVGFSEEFIEQLEAKMNSDLEEQQQRWDTLKSCREKLSEKQKQVYQHFYVNNSTAEQVAETLERSVHAIRKSIVQIRKSLFDCVDKTRLSEIE